MKHFLVVADKGFDQQMAFDKAVALAQQSDAKIHVVVMCYEEGQWINSVDDDDATIRKTLKDTLIEQAKDWWQEKIQKQQQGSSLAISIELVWEKYIVEWIINHCQSVDYDLVIKTGNRSETFFYTPSDWLLFRDSKVPVYIVSEEHNKEKKNILVALDLLTTSKEKQALNRSVLDSALRLSQLTNSELHCCYGIKIPTLVRDMDLIDVPAHIHKVEKQAYEASEDLLADYGIDKKRVHIKDGLPWQVISNVANSIKANCVVVGSQGKRGLAGKLIGNTCEKVIHMVKKDLLVIGLE